MKVWFMHTLVCGLEIKKHSLIMDSYRCSLEIVNTYSKTFLQEMLEKISVENLLSMK